MDIKNCWLSLSKGRLTLSKSLQKIYKRKQKSINIYIKANAFLLSSAFYSSLLEDDDLSGISTGNIGIAETIIFRLSVPGNLTGSWHIIFVITAVG